MNKVPYYLGEVNAIGETVSFNLLEYREIIFRVMISNGVYLYQTIPTPAIQSGYAEIVFTEDNMTFGILCFITESGIEFVNRSSAWSPWFIELIGIK